MKRQLDNFRWLIRGIAKSAKVEGWTEEKLEEILEDTYLYASPHMPWAHKDFAIATCAYLKRRQSRQDTKTNTKLSVVRNK